MISNRLHKKIYILVILFALFFSISPSVLIVHAQAAKPQVIAQAKTNIRELPKTGLPLAALALVAILPGGLILRRVTRKSKVTADHSANSIWSERQSGR